MDRRGALLVNLEAVAKADAAFLLHRALVVGDEARAERLVLRRLLSGYVRAFHFPFSCFPVSKPSRELESNYNGKGC